MKRNSLTLGAMPASTSPSIKLVPSLKDSKYSKTEKIHWKTFIKFNINAFLAHILYGKDDVIIARFI